MNPYTSPTDTAVAADARPTFMSLRKLLLVNLLGCLLFPLMVIVFLLVFLRSEEAAGIALLIYSLMHLVFLWVGLLRTTHAWPLLGPSLAVALFLTLYNRHWMGQPDNSPFSNGIGTVDQRAYGWFAYLRVFDQPDARWGTMYIDYAALACDVELLVLSIVVMGGVRWLLWCKD